MSQYIVIVICRGVFAPKNNINLICNKRGGGDLQTKNNLFSCQFIIFKGIHSKKISSKLNNQYYIVLKNILHFFAFLIQKTIQYFLFNYNWINMYSLDKSLHRAGNLYFNNIFNI